MNNKKWTMEGVYLTRIFTCHMIICICICIFCQASWFMIANLKMHFSLCLSSQKVFALEVKDLDMRCQSADASTSRDGFPPKRTSQLESHIITGTKWTIATFVKYSLVMLKMEYYSTVEEWKIKMQLQLQFKYPVTCSEPLTCQISKALLWAGVTKRYLRNRFV